MTFAAEMAAEALALLDEFGQAATLTRTTSGAYDPATGAPATGTSATYTGRAYADQYAQRDIDGSLVRQGDQRAYIATDGMVPPKTGHTLALGGTTYSVISAGHWNVAGTPVMYWAQIRGVA